MFPNPFGQTQAELLRRGGQSPELRIIISLIQYFYFSVPFFLGQAGGREGEGAEETRCLLQRAAGSAGREGKTNFFPFNEHFPPFSPFSSFLLLVIFTR